MKIHKFKHNKFPKTLEFIIYQKIDNHSINSSNYEVAHCQTSEETIGPQKIKKIQKISDFKLILKLYSKLISNPTGRSLALEAGSLKKSQET